MEESEDEEAGELVTGWQLGLAGACEGERRRIMAYGETGTFRLMPPRVSSALVTMLIMLISVIIMPKEGLK